MASAAERTWYSWNPMPRRNAEATVSFLLISAAVGACWGKAAGSAANAPREQKRLRTKTDSGDFSGSAVKFMKGTSAWSLPPFNLLRSGQRQLIEKAGIKKSLRKSKVSLDKIVACGTLSLVEKCAPIQSGRFAFWALPHVLANNSFLMVSRRLKPVLRDVSRRFANERTRLRKSRAQPPRHPGQAELAVPQKEPKCRAIRM